MRTLFSKLTSLSLQHSSFVSGICLFLISYLGGILITCLSGISCKSRKKYKLIIEIKPTSVKPLSKRIHELDQNSDSQEDIFTHFPFQLSEGITIIDYCLKTCTNSLLDRYIHQQTLLLWPTSTPRQGRASCNYKKPAKLGDYILSK